MTQKWAIVSYRAGQNPGRDYVQSSIGRGYRELKTIARRMNSNGEGQRYAVVRYYEQPSASLVGTQDQPLVEARTSETHAQLGNEKVLAAPEVGL